MPKTDIDIRALRLHFEKQAVAFVTRGSLQAANELKGILGPRSGPRTGRVYKRGDKTHTASAAGEAPAPDSGRLRQSATHHPVRKEGKKIIGSAGVATPYALALEVGTENMRPRPFVSRLGEAEHADRIFQAATQALDRD